MIMIIRGKTVEHNVCSLKIQKINVKWCKHFSFCSFLTVFHESCGQNPHSSFEMSNGSRAGTGSFKPRTEPAVGASPDS